MTDLTVLIPAKDEPTVLEKTIEAFKREGWEVVVITPENDPGKKIAEDNNARVVLFNSNTKAAALKAGLKHCDSKFVGIYDADTRPEDKTVERLLSDIKDNGACFGPIKIYETGLMERIVSLEYNYVALIDELLSKLNQPLSLHGTNYVIRRELADFDETVLVEDVAISMRLLDLNEKIIYSPDAWAWQESPSGFFDLIAQRRRWTRGFMQITLRHGLPFSLLLAYSSFGILSLLSFGAIFVSPTAFISLTAVIFCILVISQIKAKGKIANLAFMPALMLFYGLLFPVMMLYGLFEEIRGTPTTWFKTPRNKRAATD